MVKVRAVVYWVTRDEGGRRQPPSGVGSTAYSAVVRFTDTDEPWPPPEAWSLAVEKDEGSSEPLLWLADVHFVAEHAPRDSLRPGRPFDLYEGSRRVAHGEILPEPARSHPAEAHAGAPTRPAENRSHSIS